MSDLAARIQKPFHVAVSATMNVNSVESPFIVHWLEVQADRHMAAAAAGHGNPPHSRSQAAQLYLAAMAVAGVWCNHEEDRARLQVKIDGVHAQPLTRR